MLTDLIVLAFLKIAPRHGYDIRKYVDRILTGPRKLNTNLLYPSLHRLEKLGAVQREDCEQSGKRSRHMYRITAEGEKRFLEMISDFGDTEAEKDEEFTVRVAFFEFINRTNRQAILERRREVLRKRVALRRSRQESLAEIYSSPWIKRIVEHRENRNLQELSWIDDLTDLSTKEADRE
jgi:DNA-binding PadR family transcriptional regulator